MLYWLTMPFSFMRGYHNRYGDRFTVSLSHRLPPVVFFSNPQALTVQKLGDFAVKIARNSFTSLKLHPAGLEPATL